MTSKQFPACCGCQMLYGYGSIDGQFDMVGTDRMKYDAQYTKDTKQWAAAHPGNSYGHKILYQPFYPDLATTQAVFRKQLAEDWRQALMEQRGVGILILNKQQHKFFHEVVMDIGFEHISEDHNPNNHGNIIHTYMIKKAK